MRFETPKNYYVYIYLDESLNPYYVGMGKGRRALQKHLYVDVPPFDRIQVREQGMTEEQAWDLEVELIAKIGRESLNEGPLKNLSPGGMGAKSGWNHSENTKRRISESLKGRKIKDTSRYKGTTTPEWAEKVRQARLGVKHTQERKDNIAKKMKNKRWFTDGTRSVFCEKENVPEGFSPGRIYRRKQ